MLARIENNVVSEILTPRDGFTVAQCFHKDLIAQCVEIPDHVQGGWVLVDGEWQEPVVEEVVEEEAATADPVAEEPAV